MVKNNKIVKILKSSLIVSIIFWSIIFSINAASAADRTYYWIPSSGVIDSSGFTANWGTCGSQPTSYKITILSNVGFTCGSDRLTTTAQGDQFLAIYPVAYSYNTNITGKTGATFYLSSQKTGYTATYRFDLGYAMGGTFTSLGYATKAVSSRNGQSYTVDLNTISGVVPAGSYIALKVSITTPQGGRIYLGTNGGSSGSNSGRFYVNETIVTTPPSTYNVSVRASPISATISQGNNATYNILVNNTGNTDGDYNLGISDSNSVDFSSVLGRTSIFVPAGGSNTTTLTVTANRSAQPGAIDTTTITTTSVQNPSFSNSTQVQTSTPPPPKYNVTVIASPNFSTINQGGNITYSIIVNNTGDTGGDYNLSMSDSDSGNFTPSVLDKASIFVPAGGSNTTNLTVTAKSSASPGALDITAVNATSVQNPSFTNSTQVQTGTPPPPKYNVIVTALPNFSTINQGGNIIYNISVNNIGDTDGDYNLSILDTDINNFTSSLEVTSIFVRSGGSNTTTLNVTANSSASPGAIDITTVYATSVQNPSFTNSTQVRTNTPPLPTYDVTISAIPIFANIIAGNSYTYNIFVNNTGNTNGNYTLSVADSDLVNFTNSTLGANSLQINSGNGVMTTLNVTALSNATGGSIDNTNVTVVSVENPNIQKSTGVNTTVTTTLGLNCLDCHTGDE